MGPGAQLFNFCVRERSAEAGRLDMRARALVGRDISMASTTTKGIVVSFGNTPQAQNDDNLRVYEEGGVQNLDVMGNDLGGNAKSLFALDSGRDLGSDPLRPKQLLTQDGIGEINFSKLGAKIWITANGTVGYDYSNVSDLVTNVNALAAGETITDSFIYSIRLANGTLSWATATVKLTGVNDAASVLLNASKTTGGVFEDSNVEATGWVKFKDADTSQDGLAQLVTAGTASHGTYKVDADGTWHYQVNNADNAVQALAVGQTMTDKFTVKSLDGTASTVVTITITGVNDGPTITSTAQAGAVTEDGTTTANGQVKATDVDSDAALTYSGGSSSAYGTFTVDADGKWHYVLKNNDAVQALSEGQKVTETYTVTVTDNHSATATQDVTITITGTNDAAVISGDKSAALTETDAAQTTGGTLTATDVDSPATFQAQTNAAGSNGYGKFSISTAGVWSYTTDSAHNEFVAGQDYTDTIKVYATDGTEQQLKVTITGTDDPSVITGVSTKSLTETNAVLTTGATLSVTDIDGPTPSFVAQTNAAGSNGYGKFSIDTAGVWSYTTNTAHDEFEAGHTYTDTIKVYASDGTEQLLTVNITGSADDFAFHFDTQTISVPGVTKTFSAVANESQNDTINRYKAFLSSLGTDGPDAGTDISVDPQQNQQFTNPTVEGFTGTFGPKFQGTGTGNGGGGDGRWYVSSATTAASTSTTIDNTDAVSSAVINNFHEGSDTLTFVGVTQQNFNAHFNVAIGDVTGDSVADTKITLDTDASFSIVLTGVSITKTALSGEIHFA